MTTVLRMKWRDRVSDWKPSARVCHQRRKVHQAESVPATRTTDKTHAERLKDLAARMRKFWERKS